MAVTPYRVTPARIGNSSGLRLPAAFYRDDPQFAGAAGQVEVLDDTRYCCAWSLKSSSRAKQKKTR